MSEDSPDRIEGVNFTTIEPVFEDVSYPITVDELVAQHGDQRIERTNADPITLRELFEPMGDDTFESSTDLRQMILTLMPSDSVGRENYSDRGGTQPTETEQAERLDENDSV